MTDHIRPSKAVKKIIDQALERAFDVAFKELSKKTPLVTLRMMREMLGIDLDTFRAVLRLRRQAGMYTLGSSEGTHDRPTRGDLDEGFDEGGRHVIYIYRKMRR